MLKSRSPESHWRITGTTVKQGVPLSGIVPGRRIFSFENLALLPAPDSLRYFSSPTQPILL